MNERFFFVCVYLAVDYFDHKSLYSSYKNIYSYTKIITRLSRYKMVSQLLTLLSNSFLIIDNLKNILFHKYHLAKNILSHLFHFVTFRLYYKYIQYLYDLQRLLIVMRFYCRYKSVYRLTSFNQMRHGGTCLPRSY